MANLQAFKVRDGVFAMVHDGEYKLSPKALSIYWFLLYHGMWEPGSEWFSHVDIRMTSHKVIAIATGWSVKSVQRALHELEEAEFINVFQRMSKDGRGRMNDGIRLTYPDDWCNKCHKRGAHMCSAGDWTG
jgi:hypothetical protein